MLSRASASRLRAGNGLGSAMTDDRYGRFKFRWADDGTPLDRFGRNIDQVREHAGFVAGLADDLRGIVDRCEDVLLGRETGPRFWSRFDANIAALENVVERDNRYVATLEQAEAEELAKRAPPSNDDTEDTR